MTPSLWFTLVGVVGFVCFVVAGAVGVKRGTVRPAVFALAGALVMATGFVASAVVRPGPLRLFDAAIFAGLALIVGLSIWTLSFAIRTERIRQSFRRPPSPIRADDYDDYFADEKRWQGGVMW